MTWLQRFRRCKKEVDKVEWTTIGLVYPKSKNGEVLAILDPKTGRVTLGDAARMLLTIDREGNLLDLPLSTRQLFEMILEYIIGIERKDATAVVPLSQYMRRTGIDDPNRARKELTLSLDLLGEVRMMRNTTPEDGASTFSFVNMVDYGEINEDGTATFIFTREFFRCLLLVPA